jgi:hypothetical protein
VDVVSSRPKANTQEHHAGLLRELRTEQQPSSVDATWQRFRAEWAAWETFVDHGASSQYATLPEQREAFVDTVLMGLDVGGDANKGPYHDLLAAKLDWPLTGAVASDPSSWRGDAFADSQKHAFVITTGGFMGRGPQTMEEGDVVCVLYGGRIPFALRPVGGGLLCVGGVL